MGRSKHPLELKLHILQSPFNERCIYSFRSRITLYKSNIPMKEIGLGQSMSH